MTSVAEVLDLADLADAADLAEAAELAGTAELADLIDLEHEVAWLEHFRGMLARRQARWWQWDAAMTGTDRQERAIWACEQELRQARERLSAARGEI
ncbi:MAG TPA: hypothetical protein VFV41_11060 [Streptosporangiaceae bacterium]|nr:hypothetical protein [Streptosporangiaceae bacterium]